MKIPQTEPELRRGLVALMHERGRQAAPNPEGLALTEELELVAGAYERFVGNHAAGRFVEATQCATVALAVASATQILRGYVSGWWEMLSDEPVTRSVDIRAHLIKSYRKGFESSRTGYTN